MPEISLSRTLHLERKGETNRTTMLVDREARVGVALAPGLSEDYWSYRVLLNGRQAVLGFPKFSTIGIGFAVEDDGNTNLPYTTRAIDIVSHIWHNVDSERPPDDEEGENPEGDRITVAEVYAAVEAIQAAIAKDHPDWNPPGSQPSFMAPTITGV